MYQIRPRSRQQFRAKVREVTCPGAPIFFIIPGVLGFPSSIPQGGTPCKPTLSRPVKIFALLILAVGLGEMAASGFQAAVPVDSRNILPERERARIMDDWLKWRLDNILPDLMRREGIDLWLVMSNEPDPGPVYFTLLPATTLYVVRTSILMFHDRGKELGVERLSGGSSGIGDWYKPTWLDKKNKNAV